MFPTFALETKKNNERLKHPLVSDNKKIWTHLLNNIVLNVI